MTNGSYFIFFFLSNFYIADAVFSNGTIELIHCMLLFTFLSFFHNFIIIIINYFYNAEIVIFVCISKNILSDRMHLLQGCSTRDNFNQLTGDDSLSGTVECERQFLNHFTGVLGRVVHGSHT